jgi:hypothetical protein
VAVLTDEKALLAEIVVIDVASLIMTVPSAVMVTVD